MVAPPPVMFAVLATQPMVSQRPLRLLTQAPPSSSPTSSSVPSAPPPPVPTQTQATQAPPPPPQAAATQPAPQQALCRSGDNAVARATPAQLPAPLDLPASSPT